MVALLADGTDCRDCADLARLVGFNNLALISGVIVAATPFGVVHIWQGTKGIDTDIVEMASAFNADRRSMWRDSYLPP